MATTPSAAEGKALKSLFVKLGLTVDKNATRVVDKQFKGLAKVTEQFKNSANFKGTIFDGGVLSALKSKMPQSEFLNFQKTMLGIGLASKKGAADSGEFFNSLSLAGKMGVNAVDFLGTSMTKFGVTASAAMTAATMGVAVLLSIIMKVIDTLGKVALSVIDARDELVQFDKIAGGVGNNGLLKIQAGLNKTDMAAMQLGMNLTEVNTLVADFAKNGVALNRLAGEFSTLAVTTKALATVTGESDANVASLFSGLIVKARFSQDSLKDLSNSFVKFNQVATKVGLANVSFGAMKEAIDSSTNALIVASAKGSQFAEKMSKDLINLAGLATNLGLSVGELNAKFEEAGNLLNAESSGFRALLAISGGANFNQMITGQFEKTDAMLKTVDTLQKLNKSFGGNLNVTAQIVEKQFGLSKETALKMINMSADQVKMIRETQEAIGKVETDSVKKAYDSVTGTLGDIWTKFKNSVNSIFKIGLSQNIGFQNALGKIAEKLTEWYDRLARGDGLFAQIATKLGNFAEKVGNWLAEKLPGLMDGLANWVEKIFGYFQDLFNWISSSNDNSLGGMFGMWAKMQLAMMKMAVDIGVEIARGIVSYIRDVGGLWGLTTDTKSDKERALDAIPKHIEELTSYFEQKANTLKGEGKSQEQIGKILSAELQEFMASEEVTKLGLQKEYTRGLGEAFTKSTTLNNLIGAMTQNTAAIAENTEKSKELKDIQSELAKDKAKVSELKQMGDLTVIYDKLKGQDSAGLMMAGEKRYELEQEIQEREKRMEDLAKQNADNTKKIAENTEKQQAAQKPQQASNTGKIPLRPGPMKQPSGTVYYPGT